MKKFIFSTCIGALLALAGCQESDELVNDFAGKPVTVTANIQGSPESRVVLTPGEDENRNPIVRVEWRSDENNKEKFWVFDNDFNSCQFVQTSGNQFTGTAPGETGPYYAVYGKFTTAYGGKLVYDFSEQDGALNDDDFLMMAENITDLTQPIEFKHKTAILKVSFKLDGASVDTLTNFTMEGLSGGNTITVKRKTKDDDIYIFLLITGNAYAAGTQFTFSANVEGEACTGNITIPQNMTVEAGKYYTANVTLGNKRGECNLPTGSVFNESIKSVIGNQDVKTITFETESQLTGGTRIGNSRAYALVEGTTLKVYTSEKKFIFNADCSYMFAGLSSITTIDWGSSFSTGAVGDMSYMFKDCSKLTSVNFPCESKDNFLPSLFSVRNVSSMKGMFKDCKAMQVVDWRELTIVRSPLSDMSYMFSGCTSLTGFLVNEEMFVTNNYIDMNNMFNGCTNFQSISLGANFKPIVTNMSYMFYECSKLQSADICSNFITTDLSDMSYMFYACSALTAFNVNWSKSNSIDMNNMFYACYSMEKVSFGSNFKPIVTKMNRMFYHCESLPSIDLRSFNVTDDTECEEAFLAVGWAYFDGMNKTQIYVTEDVKGVLEKKNTGISNDVTYAAFNTGTPPASN